MALAQLSAELLLLVASHLSQPDLLNVSLTSKHLRVATEPALYREFHPPCLRRRPLSKFIKALLKDPKRPNYVRSLRLPQWETIEPGNMENDSWHDHIIIQAAITGGKRIYYSMTTGWDPYKVPGECLSQGDYDLFTSAAITSGYLRNVTPYAKGAVELKSGEKNYDAYRATLFYWYYFSTANLESLPLDEQFCHLLKAGVDEAYMMLLLSLLTNLRCLSFPCVPARRTLPWARALQRFSSLREFTAIPESYYSNEYHPLSFWVNVLTLPTLELFTAHGCAGGWVQPDEVVMRSPCTRLSDSSSITRLVLESCGLEYGDLETVLGRCRNLKTFRYSIQRYRRATVTSKRIIELLAPFQMTLEELFLDNDSYAYWRRFHHEDVFVDEPFTSLAQFCHLERLWLPTHMFGNLPVAREEYRDPAVISTFAGSLPPSLKEFKLYDSHTYPLLTHPVLDCLVETASVELPDLTTLEVISSHDHSKEDLNIIEEEREIRRDSGTTFTYKFRWSHFNGFQLPQTAEEKKWYSRAATEYTCWDEDRYAIKSWDALQMPNILSREEVDEKEHEEILTILAELEDAPTCNDEIRELLETEFDEVAAMGLQFV